MINDVFTWGDNHAIGTRIILTRNSPQSPLSNHLTFSIPNSKSSLNAEAIYIGGIDKNM